MIDRPSADFDEQAVAPARRVELFAQVDRYLRDSDISAWSLKEYNNGTEITANDRGRWREVFAGADTTTYAYAMLDGQWKLETPHNDATLRLASRTDGIRAFVSHAVTDSQGYFDGLTVRIGLGDGWRSTGGGAVRIIWDAARAEYATDYIIRMRTVAGKEIEAARVIGNTYITVSHVLPQEAELIAYIDIEIKRWSIQAAGVTAKINTFSLPDAYYNLTTDDILALTLTQASGAQRGMPVGTAASARLTISIANDDGRFSMNNPASRFYQLRARDLRVLLYAGFAGSVVRVGTYYVNEWRTSDYSLTATVCAQDIVSMLGDLVFDPIMASVSYPATLATLADKVNEQAAIGIAVQMASDAAGVTVPRAPDWEAMSCREAYRIIAQAAGALVASTPISNVRIAPRDGAQYALAPEALYSITTPTTQEEAQDGALVEWVDEAGDTHEVTAGGTVQVVVRGNPLIQTQAQAQAVAQAILRSLGTGERREIAWRGNPRVEAGDALALTDKYGNALSIRVDSQTLTLAGGLKQTSSGYTTAGEG